MTIEKLPSGKYRIRQIVNGRRKSVTVPFKPTKKEAFYIMEGRQDNPSGMSFEDACNEYLKAKNNVLSPSTLRYYETTLRNIPDGFKKQPAEDIDNLVLQSCVNEYAKTHSPKTTANMYGFIRSVLAFFYPDTHICATLPQKPRAKTYRPTVDDIKTLLEYSYGSDYYIPIFLASLSLRLGEICALTLADLDGDHLTINKALVYDNHGKYVLKPTPKTDASNRTIILPPELVQAINEKGFIYNHQPNSINKYLTRNLPKMGIPYFSIHQLRHFFASYAHDLGYSDAVIQSIGGWNTDHVMKSVYRYAMDESNAKKAMASDFSF